MKYEFHPDKYPGKSKDRLSDNPDEMEFARAWHFENNRNDLGMGILGHLLGHTPSRAEKCAAATVVQWLGSPVGSHFLRSVLYKIETK